MAGPEFARSIGFARIHSDSNRLLWIALRSATLARQLKKTGDATETTERWASVEDIARHLGVTRDSVYRWTERRGRPGHRIGRLWKFKISEVDEWVRAGGADSGGDAVKSG